MRFLAPSALGRDAAPPAATTDPGASKSSLYGVDAPFSSSATSVATIILRGGCMRTLARVKAVLDLCLFVAHNLRLEECLARDEGTQLCPTQTTTAVKAVPLDGETTSGCTEQSEKPSASNGDASLGGTAPLTQDELGARIESSLRPYERTLLSASCTIRHNIPYPISTMRAGHEKLLRLEQGMKADTDSSERREAQQEPDGKDINEKQPTSDVAAEANLAEKPGTDSTQSDGEKRAADDEVSSSVSSSPEKAVAAQHSALAVTNLETVLPTPALLARETEYRLAQLEHERAQQAWEAHLAAPSRLSPFEHQRLVVLASNVSSITQRPCSGPELRTVEFYGEGDETLGRFLERMCAESVTPCSNKSCGRPRLAHFSGE